MYSLLYVICDACVRATVCACVCLHGELGQLNKHMRMMMMLLIAYEIPTHTHPRTHTAYAEILSDAEQVHSHGVLYVRNRTMEVFIICTDSSIAIIPF